MVNFLIFFYYFYVMVLPSKPSECHSYSHVASFHTDTGLGSAADLIYGPDARFHLQTKPSSIFWPWIYFCLAQTLHTHIYIGIWEDSLIVLLLIFEVSFQIVNQKLWWTCTHFVLIFFIWKQTSQMNRLHNLTLCYPGEMYMVKILGLYSSRYCFDLSGVEECLQL